ncbi:MAG: hypothetical protein PVG53_01410 [Holophagae bacterium]|jgi:hypothetical protein
MSRIRLIASSDDYLLEQRLADAVDGLCRQLGGVEPEILPEEATPDAAATELVSPSLFADNRVLVVPEAGVWLGARPPAGVAVPKAETPDNGPLIEVLNAGVPDGVALVLGAWCGRRPSGPLVDAIEASGSVDWVPLPAPPKPWEDTLLSGEQERVLTALLERTADGVSFEPAARQLLLERLGFAPRLLVQEVRKLTAAAAGAVDEALVRRLTFPRERSLEVVRDAVLARAPGPLFDLVAAAGVGAPINDWQGRRVDGDAVAVIVHAQVSRLALQMLYLRRLAAGLGVDAEMAPEATSQRQWYPKRFKSDIAPDLLEAVKNDAPSPLRPPGGRAPTAFVLGALFAGAGRYSDDELTASIVDASAAEVQIRQRPHALDALTAWLAGFVATG